MYQQPLARQFTGSRSNYASSVGTKGLTFLDRDQVKAVAPSVFAEQAKADRSERYVFIPTFTALGALEDQGWGVVKAAQSRTRDPDGHEYVKHVVRLQKRHDRAPIVSGVFPEIILTNSHNGGSSFQMDLGLFRWVCANGLAVMDDSVQAMKFRHSRVTTQDVIDAQFEMAAELPAVAETIERFQQVRLNRDEALAFANAAAEIRFGEDARNPQLVPRLLMPKRREDTGPDLFTTMNVVQENVIRGHVPYTNKDQEGKTRHNRTRAVASPIEDLRINRAIWKLTQEMAKLKMA